MTEVEDGARILQKHVQELLDAGVIDVQEKQRLQDEIRIIREDIESHYEEMA